MRRPWTAPSAALLPICVAGLLVWGYLRGQREVALEAKREATVKPAVQLLRNVRGEPTIVLDRLLQQQSHIEARLARVIRYRQQLAAYGSILDLQAFTELSNTIATANAALATAEAKLAASKAVYDRARILVRDQSMSTAQLQSAEANYRSDEASVNGARVQSRNAAAIALQFWGPILGRSLANGTGLASDLVQHKKVLVQVTLPMGVSLDRPPGQASIETTTGSRVRVELVSAATRTDPRIQGMSFFYVANAEGHALPGMNVVAHLGAGSERQGVSVPPSAVVWLDGKAWIFVETAPLHYTRRRIPTDVPASDGGYVVPLAGSAMRVDVDPLETGTSALGVRDDQPVVTRGAQLLLSQEFSSQIQFGSD